MGKIHAFQKSAVNFEPTMQFGIFWDLECLKPDQHSLFYDWLHNIIPCGRGAAVTTAEEEEPSVSDLIT